MISGYLINNKIPVYYTLLGNTEDEIVKRLLIASVNLEAIPWASQYSKERGRACKEGGFVRRG